jgi:hypothetical protein
MDRLIKEAHYAMYAALDGSDSRPRLSTQSAAR